MDNDTTVTTDDLQRLISYIGGNLLVTHAEEGDFE